MIVFSVDYSLNKPALTVYLEPTAANAAPSVFIHLFPSRISSKTKDTLSSYGINIHEQDLPINARKGDEVQNLIRAKHLSNSITNIISLYKTKYPNQPTLLVIEGASYNSSGSSSLDLIGGKFVFLNDVLSMVDNIISIPPTSIKKFITGKGNASKEDVIDSVSKQTVLNHPIIPHLNELKTPQGNHLQCVDDIADSVALLLTYLSKQPESK